MSSIMSLLGGGGQQAPQGGPPPGVAPSIQLGGPQGAAPQKSDGDWQTDLQNALAALRELAGDAKDPIEANTIDKCIAALSALTATRQKQSDAALGTTQAHKAMGRAYS